MKKLIVTLFLGAALFSSQTAFAEGEGDAPKTEEVKSEEKKEEVAPIPVEKVEEVEGAKEAKEEKKEEAKKEEKKEEAIAKTDQEAVEDAVALWKAIETQNWPLAAGFLIMILVYAFNRFGLKNLIGAKAIPYVSIALGVLAAVGVALASGGSISAALAAGMTAGLAAVGSWEAVFKKMLGSESKSEAAEEAAA